MEKQRIMKNRLIRFASLLLIALLLLGCAGTLSEERLAEVPTINPPVQIPANIDLYPAIQDQNPGLKPVTHRSPKMIIFVYILTKIPPQLL